MKFWRIQEPDYESDYHHTYLNGSLEHPYGLPGVECDLCDDVWAGSRILRYDFPEKYTHHKNIFEKWPIKRELHKALQKEIIQELNLAGEAFITLKPGDDFQPCFLDIPSKPDADFLWPSLGGPLVSAGVKDLLLKPCPTDIFACQVMPRIVGDLDPNTGPPIPSSGEPEDIINEVPLMDDLSEFGPYFEIVIRNESDFPPGGSPVSICPGCHRQNINNSTRELIMTNDIWKGNQIFYLNTTLYIVITDELKREIEKLNPTNVIFKRI